MTVPISNMPKLANLIGFDSFSEQDVHYQLDPQELVEQTLVRGMGKLDKNGALCVNTGEFTGRSPLDKFIVNDSVARSTVHWNNFNIPIDEQYFFALKDKMFHYLQNKKEIWVRDCLACADENYQMKIRVINENPWSNLFCYNMFLRPENNSFQQFEPEWHIIQAPGFKANPAVDGTRQHNFAIVSLKHRTILIGGTGYTGEMKKGIFSVLNYILPLQRNVLSMHCSANLGKNNDVALFFGLSGTGKTTLSADPNRFLIGDDEHG